MGTVTSALGRLTYFDANIVIHVLEGFPQSGQALRKILAAMDNGELAVVTSELTAAEVLVKPKKENNTVLEAAYLQFLQPSQAMRIVPVTMDILLVASHLRATSPLKLPDAIHFATAKSEGCNSFLTNDRCFQDNMGVHIALLDQLDLA